MSVLFDRDELIAATSGELLARGRDGAGPVGTDTRTLPAGAWFVALRGDRFDGHAFLEVAVSKMANAIRELALRHGEDAGRFTLVPFGGAAGQHACAVADALGIDALLLHPLAGVLSVRAVSPQSPQYPQHLPAPPDIATDSTAVAPGPQRVFKD